MSTCRTIPKIKEETPIPRAVKERAAGEEEEARVLLDREEELRVLVRAAVAEARLGRAREEENLRTAKSREKHLPVCGARSLAIRSISVTR